jgi:hypothetical protein
VYGDKHSDRRKSIEINNVLCIGFLVLTRNRRPRAVDIYATA